MTETTEPMVREDGTYPTEALRRDMIVATVVQTRVSGVDGANPGPDIRKNLDYFLECIDIAQTGLPSDLLLFHEFPIMGFTEWTREQHYNLSIEVPGPEVEEVGKKAKQYNCYIVFGTYAKDPENWPGHILHLMVMMGPDGITMSTIVSSKCMESMQSFRSYAPTSAISRCRPCSSNRNYSDAWHSRARKSCAGSQPVASSMTTCA